MTDQMVPLADVLSVVNECREPFKLDGLHADRVAGMDDVARALRARFARPAADQPQPTAAPTDDWSFALPGSETYSARKAVFDAGFQAGVQAARGVVVEELADWQSPQQGHTAISVLLRALDGKIVRNWQPDPAPKDGD